MLVSWQDIQENAVHILESIPGGAKDGTFIVRESVSSVGHYVLCLKARNTDHHFQIVNHGDAWFSIDNGPVFQGLDDLVHHYSQAPDGLPTQLRTFVPGMPPPATTRKRLDTDLHAAVVKNNIEAVKKILKAPYFQKTGDVNSRNQDGCTPVHEAAKYGHSEILRLLLAKNPDVHIRDGTGATPLHVSYFYFMLHCYLCMPYVIVVLCVFLVSIVTVCGISIVKSYQYISVCLGGLQHNQSECTLLLIKEGNAGVQERNSKTDWVPLHETALRGSVDCCRVLLQNHAPVRPRTQDKDTPRELAVRYNKTAIVELIDTADMNYPPARTKTTQWLHRRCDRTHAVEMLIQNGAQDGMFLVRPHSRRPNLYALTLMLGQKPYHYEILSQSDRWFYIDDGPLFKSIEQVIDHYSLFSDGLPTILQKPVSPEGGHALVLHKPRGPLDVNMLFKKRVPPPAPKPPKRPPPAPSRDTAPVKEAPISVVAMSASPKVQALIDVKDLTLGEELGEGEFGSVLKGKWKNHDGKLLDVAIKTLHKDAMVHGSKEFLREADIMRGLDHHCIVKLLGVVLGKNMMLVQELVPLGSLINYLQDTSTHAQPMITTLKLWAAEIASGMTYLEEKRFVHRDLAARNILVASLKQVKISDFGLSRAVGANSNYYQASQGGRWPVKWYAPESVNYGTFSSASDVWSYGVTLWEMFSYGQQPYGDKTGADVLEFVEGGGRLECPKNCPNSIYSLMLECWSMEPSGRPTFKKLHDVFMNSPEYQSLPHRELYASVGGGL